MSSDMVERCGAAMMRTQAGRKLTSEFTDDEIRDFVRAAIEAMREPTEAMESAFFDANSEAETFFAEPAHCWRAMIDAALQESSHE